MKNMGKLFIKHLNIQKKKKKEVIDVHSQQQTTV